MVGTLPKTGMAERLLWTVRAAMVIVILGLLALAVEGLFKRREEKRTR